MRRITAKVLVALMVMSSLGSLDSYAAGAGTVSDENIASGTDAELQQSEETMIQDVKEEGDEEEEEILIPISEETTETYEERTEDRIHYIKLNGNYTQSSDAILIESNGHFGLIDTSNKSGDTQYGIPIDRSASGAAVLDYLCELGVTHLDFILATHAHSDHIGGIPEIAQFLLKTDITTVEEYQPINIDVTVTDENGKPVNPSTLKEDGGEGGDEPEPEPEPVEGERPLVDENTTYIYKSFTPNVSESEWENEKYYDDADKAMAIANKLVVNNPTDEAMNFIGAVSSKNPSDNYEDTISFKFGDMDISLYNLYSRSNTNENANSILTYIEKSGVKTVLLADIDVYDSIEQRLATVITKQHGKVDVMKVGHHGFERSTSKELIDILGAKYAVIQTANQFLNLYCPFYGYMKQKGMNVYRNLDQPGLSVIQDMTENLSFGNGDSAEITPIEAYKCEKVTTYQIEGDDTQYKIITETTVIMREHSVVSSSLATDWVQTEGIKNWAKWYKDWDEYDWVFVQEDGSLVKGWKTINNADYFFNDDGILQTGWVKRNGKDVYLIPEDYNDWKMGSMIKGWYKMKGDKKTWWYFGPDGSKFNGWLNNNGDWYYIIDGKMFAGGVKNIGGNDYRFDSNGKLMTGWVKIDGKQYYFDPDGKIHRGWIQSGSKWYYTDKDGKVVTGSYNCGGKTYIFDGNGVMSGGRGWIEANGKWYYSYEDGTAYTGWVSGQAGWYYINSDGSMATKMWVNSGGWYYINQWGLMATGWVEDGKTWYCMDDSGLMRTGWVESVSGWYYMNPSGAMATGWVIDGGTWYFMKDSGAMATGWVQSGVIWYYMNPSGAMVTGSHTIGGKNYTFNGDGALL